MKSATIRWADYVLWSLHHSKDHISLEEWREAWEGGLIR
jgi:hypothetical protein